MRFMLLGLLLLNAGAIAGETPAKIKKVLLIGIDGCRPDALEAAHTPNLDALIKDGVLVLNTKIIGERETDADTISGPGWSNILCGVWPDKHGVKNNEFKGSNYSAYPHFFARLKEQRPTAFTVSLEDWEPIKRFIVSAADIAESFVPPNKDYAISDQWMANTACEILQNKNPDAMFIYFGNVDETGHKKVFHPDSPAYIGAIELADRQLGPVLAALRGRKTLAQEDWLIVVCTDHGGIGTNHGGGRNKPEIHDVFLIVSGPAAPKKVDGPTSHVDIVPTLLTHLGVTIKPEWKLDGRPVGVKQ